MMDRGWHEQDGGRRPEGRQGTIVLGALLIALGVAFLVSDQLNFDWERYGWPIFVIVPGLFLLLIGLAIPNEAGLGLAVPGGIVTTVGLILAFQDATAAWASWAYAWALVAPGSVGVTLSAYGLLHRRLDLLDAGLRTAAVGLGLFVGFGLFFENIVGIDRDHQSTVLQNALPILAIILGALIVLMNLLPRPGSRSGRPASDEWSEGQQAPPATPAPPASPAGPQG
jgi:dipeptide/tripeptide permease